MDAVDVIKTLIYNSPTGIYTTSRSTELEYSEFTIKDQTYLVIHPDKLREWLASSLHRGVIDYSPKTENRILNPPTDWVIRCSCGEFEEWFKESELDKGRPFDAPKIPNENWEAHVKEAIRILTVEYKEDWSDLV